jgi:ribosomal protein L40E
MGCFFGIFLIFCIVFYGFILPRMIRFRRNQKRERLEQKMQEKRLNAEIEIMKQKAANDLKPRFCQYCGAKITSDATHCTSCGASFK